MFGNMWLVMRADPEGAIRMTALILGPVLLIIMLALPAPAGLGREGWAVAAVCLLMALWWMTEAVPLAATALLPLVFFPALGIGSIEATASSFANPLIFLFLGGFLMATAIDRKSVV